MELTHCLTSDGKRLDGAWYPATTGAAETVLIMHHGVGGNFYGGAFFSEATPRLLERGISVLRANNRGHDIVSRDTDGGLLGAAYEAMDGCHADWEAWCGAAEVRGASRIVLWGHSLGAVKSILYVANRPNQKVVAIIASSPPRFSYSQFSLNHEEWPEFEATYEAAVAKIGQQRGHELMNVRKPTPLLISAERFVEKYGPHEAFDYTKHVGAISQCPVLITIGSKEGIEVRPGLSRLAFWDAARYLPNLASTQDNVSFASIVDGDHAYRGVSEVLASEVIGFLERSGVLACDSQTRRNGVSEGT